MAVNLYTEVSFTSHEIKSSLTLIFCHTEDILLTQYVKKFSYLPKLRQNCSILDEKQNKHRENNKLER